MTLTIAIDGYAGCGKSTIAKGLAQEFGLTYITTGSMYRAITVACLDAGIEGRDTDAVTVQLDEITLAYREVDGDLHIFLNGEDIQHRIRTEEVHHHISAIASNPAVRRFCVAQQQEMARAGDVVMDGRDMAAVVMPDADVKLRVTADAMVRAQRRRDEMSPAQQQKTSLTEVCDRIVRRDHLDETEGGLVHVPEAIVLDTSALTIEGQIERACEIVREVMG